MTITAAARDNAVHDTAVYDAAIEDATRHDATRHDATLRDAATEDATIYETAIEDQARFERDAIPFMRQMYPAAVRLTRDRHDAEDLIQETFVRAFQKFHQFTPGTNLRAWLYCIMFRTFYSACRHRSRRPAEILAADLHETGDGQLAPQSASAESQALGQFGDSEVMRALAALPDRFKTAIYLADVEGYRYADIADMMGTPLGTVMSRVHRGRRMLRAKLSPPAVAAPASAAVHRQARPRERGSREQVAAPLAA